MKILQLCNKPPLPANDGGCMAMHAITKGLQELGHEVNIISLFTAKHPFQRKKLSSDYLNSTKFIEVFVNTKVNWVEAYSSLVTRDSYNLSRFFTPDFDIELTKVLKKIDFDVIQLESLFMCPYIETIRKYSDAKIVLRAHNLEFKLWQRRALNEKNYLKSKYKNYLSKELEKYEIHYFSQVDGIASITDQDKDEMIQRGIKKPIKTIPFGIDVSELEGSNTSIEDNSLFHLGAMDWDPNVEGIKWFCDEVIPSLRSEDPNAKFYLAGKKSEQLIGKEEFTGAEIVGEVPSSKAFINSKDIMIVPLKSAGGMRIKIIEGLALGKPIISTSIGLEGIDAKHEEHIMIANNREEYLYAIHRLRNDPGFKEKIKQNAKKLVREKYDRKKIMLDLVDFYRRLIKE